MALYVTNLARKGQLKLQTFRRVYEGLRKAKDITQGIDYEHQGRHDLLLGVLGAVGLVTYAYISGHLGLPDADKVFLVAGLSGSGNKMDLGDGVIARRYKDGTGSITVPDTSVIMRGMSMEETSQYFRRPTQAEKKREKLQEKLYEQSKFTRETTDWFIEKGNTLEEVAHARDARELKH